MRYDITTTMFYSLLEFPAHISFHPYHHFERMPPPCDCLQAMLTNDGLVYACGTFRDANGSIGLTEDGPQKEAVHLKCDKRIVKIVSGSDHILALSEEGLIFSAGECYSPPCLPGLILVPWFKYHFRL